MRLFRPCSFARWFYPDAIFRIKTTEKVLWLTFDDGPDPVSTPVILDILDKRKVKALFFCSGSAAEKYPDLIEQINAKGHLIGNHGYSHLNGWRTSAVNYLTDVERAASKTSSSLFRPPFGRLSLKQYYKLKTKYKIIFWDIMPYDFDISFGPKSTLEILKRKMRSGSIIVLHDTSKSTVTLILDDFIRFANNEGYSFELM
ncbi:MAG: polysaccharide deacetylase family protein [Bacteroidales bacterium]|nr:polysaccharide deacetylase family protein [Bacteroidales bacterium]